MECYPCRKNDEFDQLPPRERIAADAWWRVAHGFNSALPGWLILVPRRHVTSIAELTDAEASASGLWQVRLSRALAEVTGCAKTYVMQFAEKEGFAHVHFHVVPRLPDLAADRRGPGVFRYLDDDQRLSDAERDTIAADLRAALAGGRYGSPG
ncbi:HIT family protein [Cryptosporangium minutisporangium]|uniref:HIT domain-containing protein n=1 Tax=Cryptosporangium minutisporangium TaxID=113569 RepID=A0ABP6SZW5_9ACTN